VVLGIFSYWLWSQTSADRVFSVPTSMVRRCPSGEQEVAVMNLGPGRAGQRAVQGYDTHCEPADQAGRCAQGRVLVDIDGQRGCEERSYVLGLVGKRA
jgi:hypothetical protein